MRIPFPAAPARPAIAAARLVMALALVTTLAMAAAAAVPASKTAQAPAAFHTRKVVILIYPGVEVLDFTGPAEVFAAAGQQGRLDGKPAFDVFTVSKTRDPIVSQGFLDVIPDHAIADCPQPDILVLPGGGSNAVTGDAEWMAWVKQAAGKAEHVLTVCTGAMIAGDAGLLDGHDATTWYNAVPALAKRYPKARVSPGRRFIDNGQLITTAGVSAGIDGSLHLVARLAGRYVADRTAEYMEYKWSPESYLSAHYSMLNPQLDARGRELQRGAILLHDDDAAGAVEAYRALTKTTPTDAEAWVGLARALHTLKRYDEAIAANLEARKGETQRPAACYNLACEYALTGRRDLALEALSSAIDSGIKRRSAFEGDEELAALRSDPRFQKLMAALP